MAGDTTRHTGSDNRKNVSNTCGAYCSIEPSFIHPTHAESLMNGLNNLRAASKLFDVSLITEGRTFQAHRVVLAACSDYFCAMFSCQAMREAHQSEIQLEGISAHGIELLLEYAYTSKLELDRNNVQDVLSAATHVQMKDVVEACSNFLESQIDLENCVGIATLADLYSLNTLKRRSYRYICARLSEFANTPDLLALSWDQMECILGCNFPVDCPEERVLEITSEYCLKNNLKTELARLLLANIRFGEISTCALQTITRGWSECNNIVDEQHRTDPNEPSKSSNIFYKLIIAEQMKQNQRFSNNKSLANNLSSKELTSRDVLVNSRGMELTLVKIGGFEPDGLTNEISCFLPSKGKWEVLTVIPHIEQCNYGTAVLGNDLYVVGGSYDVCLKEYIHSFGFRYCPTKNKWKTMAPIQADRCRFSLNAMGQNFLYAVGGVCDLNDFEGSSDFWGPDMPFSNCERYNANTDQWEYLPALTENRSQHAGVVLGEKLYVSGGIDRHVVLSSLWCFDTTAEVWSKLSCMPTPRADHVLIALDGRIYACGGWFEDSVSELRVLAETIDVYDVERNQWTVETVNPTPKYYTGVAALGRKIYFIGGLLSTATINRATSAVQCYDLETKTWSVNSDWQYPQEVWECACTAFYVPSERDDLKLCWSNGSGGGGGGLGGGGNSDT